MSGKLPLEVGRGGDMFIGIIKKLTLKLTVKISTKILGFNIL